MAWFRNDERRIAELMQRATELLQSHDPMGAEASCRDALELALAELGPHDPRLVSLHSAHATMQLHCGRAKDAAQTAMEGVRLAEQYTWESDDYERALRVLSLAEYASGTVRTAVVTLERFVEIASDPTDRIVAMLELVSWQREIGQFRAALVQADEAIRIASDGATRATAQELKSVVLVDLGEHRAAIDLLNEVLSMQGRDRSPSGYRDPARGTASALTTSNLALALARAGQLEPAKAAHDEAMQLLERSEDPGGAARAVLHLHRAEILLADGQIDEATRLARLSVEYFDQPDGIVWLRARSLVLLAEIRVAAGERSDASRLAQVALALCEGRLLSTHPTMRVAKALVRGGA